MSEFQLEAREFQDLTRWRWVLTGPDGLLAADHEVQLDAACWQLEAVADLPRYLAWHAAPDRRNEDEARIIAQLGAWIGAQVLGPIGTALVNARPATVRVIVPGQPEAARSLLLWPFELAHAQDQPLATQNVTLVMQFAEAAGPVTASPVTASPATVGMATSGVGARLRMLGLFSLPTGGGTLNLRQERRALVSLLSRLAASERAVDVRVLQYGVTRDRLRSVLEEEEGWDVVHISGHGAPGELLLETEDGAPDRVGAAELAALLETARARVKLVTLSACWSAALTVAGPRQMLGLARPEADGADQGAGGAQDAGNEESATQRDGSGAGTLATELAARLGCAVLAMRYPVADAFAAALTSRVYDLVAGSGQPVPRALGTALRQTVAELPAAVCPPLSAVTPALFGARAAGLTLAAPYHAEAEGHDIQALKMPAFPPPPERFVGRTAVMARASASLAARSGTPGVWLYGMPGGGKTACALELAYTHEHAFDRLVWFKAPDEDQDPGTSLTDFAITLERGLPGFQMIHVLADEERLAAFLPGLTQLLEQRRVLIVIDNVESLLTEAGRWRDARWEQVIRALCAHRGLGRIVLTSRRPPASRYGLRVETVDALSLDEALLLASELPHLSALIQGRLPAVNPGVARRLARGVLNTAQGHPKLLELADGQAADAARLTALVRAGDQAWQRTGGVPEGFFATGDPQAAGEDYRHVLGAWTRMVFDGLTEGQRTLGWFLCCLEEHDRNRWILDGNWAGLWQRLKLDGEPPGLAEALAVLGRCGLIAIRPETDNASQAYGIHPGVAAAGRDQAGREFRTAVDVQLAVCWVAWANRAREQETEQTMTPLIIHAGVAAAPYLIRRQEWHAARAMLEDAFSRQKSRATAAAVLPALQVITASSQDPAAAVALAGVQQIIDPATAEREMRAALESAVASGDYWTAAKAGGILVNICFRDGRPAEALALSEQQAGYLRQGGLGPWTQLLHDTVRLEILTAMGQAELTFAELQGLRERMEELPPESARNETAAPWMVREKLLDTSREAARVLGRWEEALELNAAQVAHMRDRGAPAGEVARIWYNDYFPLLALERADDAMALLLQCRQLFEKAHDIQGLGHVLTALAHAEELRGHREAAISLQCDALRYAYLAGDMTAAAAVGHHNLGTHLRLAGQAAGALAHHLAAALIRTLIPAEGIDRSVDEAAEDLRALGHGCTGPTNVAELCGQVNMVAGVDLERLIATLGSGPDVVGQVFLGLSGRARSLAAGSSIFLPTSAHLPSMMAAWDPVIAALLAAEDGDQAAAAALDAELARSQGVAAWAGLVAALRRLRAGDSGPQLLTGLNEVDSAIVTRALDARGGTVSIPAGLWPAIQLGPLLGIVVAGAAGDHAAAGQARQALAPLAGNQVLSPLATALERILDGDRDPGLADQFEDSVLGAVVATVLHHLGS